MDADDPSLKKTLWVHMAAQFNAIDVIIGKLTRVKCLSGHDELLLEYTFPRFL